MLAPLRELGTPLADMSGTTPYVESQSALDELFPDGGRYYWKSHFVDELSDELIDTLVDLRRRPAPAGVGDLHPHPRRRHRPGRPRRRPPTRTARPGSTSASTPSWHDPSARRRPPSTGPARPGSAVAPFATGGVYLNFAGLGDDADLEAAALGHNEDRLDEIRRAYDPDGIFAAAGRRP